MGGIRNIIALCLLFSAVVVYAGDPVNDYARAQKCYHQLNKTSVRAWNRCLKQFADLRSQFPNSEEAKKALFSEGRLHQERFEAVAKPDDPDQAIHKFNQFLRQYPHHSLADDALFRIAQLRHEKQGSKEKARVALQALLQRYPEGDMAGRAEDALRQLESGGGADSKTTALPAVEQPNDFVVRTVVIDPGHGGQDTGAKGPKGTKEAVVSLQIAQKVAAQIKKELGLTVWLTRTSPKTVTLEERGRFSERKKADLFISIHANASTLRKAKGVQTFYLNNATSEAAERLATQENKFAGKPVDLSSRILTTMLQNANTDESRDLATAVQKSLIGELGRHYSDVQDLNVATALFYVLVGVKVPSILVETAFLSNPTEERRLIDSTYQWRVAKGIAEGVKAYLQSRGASAVSSL